MKNILITYILLFSIGVSTAQEIEFLDTKEVVNFSEKYGLDSALTLNNNIPLYTLDTISAISLFNQIPKNKPSEGIESYMVNFCLNIEFDSIIKNSIVNEFYEAKLNSYKIEIPLRYGWIPKTQNNPLIVLTTYKTFNTEQTLLAYYNLWQEAAQEYEADYKKGLIEKDNVKKEKLMSKYEIANHNCIKYLLALKRINSEFYNYSKIELHNEFVKDYHRTSEKSTLYQNKNYDRFDGISLDSTTIILTKEVQGLTEINIKNNKELKTLIKKYSKSDCWRFMLFNNNDGILDLGCQFGPLNGFGSIYRVKLLDNKKLILYRLTTWIS